MFNKSMLPLVVVFLVICGLVFGFREMLIQKGFDWEVLIGGNIFLYLVTSISMHLLNKGMAAPNTHAFLRNAYGGIMVKLFACAAAAFIYIVVAGDNLNKPALFACMGLYLVYTFLEMRIVLQQSNQKKNG
jgi:hypothetical protein